MSYLLNTFLPAVPKLKYLSSNVAAPFDIKPDIILIGGPAGPVDTARRCPYGMEGEGKREFSTSYRKEHVCANAT